MGRSATAAEPRPNDAIASRMTTNDVPRLAWWITNHVEVAKRRIASRRRVPFSSILLSFKLGYGVRLSLSTTEKEGYFSRERQADRVVSKGVAAVDFRGLLERPHPKPHRHHM